jgi:carboxymethylenebutenolidase
MDEIGPIVASCLDAQVMSDLDATVAWATASGVADPAKLAITGFLLGRPHRPGCMPPITRR